MKAADHSLNGIQYRASPGPSVAATSAEKTVIGLDKGLKQVYEKVKAVARYPVEVLILGESGTGKELIADLIHTLSERNDKPLIAVNCGAIPEALFESELFGYTKGAFTGATYDKQGRIELADHSTLFLDEIGELTRNAQVKLLRVLEVKAVNRIGSHAKMAKAVDFRLITATNIDLKEAIRENRFRSDLYYRIAKFVIDLPPLRARKEDIMDLARYFIAKYCRRFNQSLKKIEKRAERNLLEYDWPGNVRELENEIENAIICSGEKEFLDLECFDFYKDIKQPFRSGGEKVKVIFPDPTALPTAHEIRDLLLQEALRRTNNNQSQAARLIGIRHQAVSQRIKKLQCKFMD